MSMADLLAKANSGAAETSWWNVPFPSLDTLNQSCSSVLRTRDMTAAIERAFLGFKDNLKVVLDPLTQPLSWLLDGSLALFVGAPWWLLISLILIVTYFASRNVLVTIFVAFSFFLLAFIDHYTHAIQTLSIIFVCTVLSVLIGVPLGIAMSKSNGFQRFTIPILDMLQTLPSFVYLIPLIFLFSVTESKLYG